MIRFVTRSLPLLAATGVAICLAIVVAVAQTAPTGSPAAAPSSPGAPGQPGTGGGPRGPRGPRPAPVNIKALPKNISGDDLQKLMHEYEGDLGVQCEFCHYTDPATRRLAFPSDANSMKDTARYMITMTADLNDQYLENLPGRRYADPITCGTCHRGASHPAIFEPKQQQRPGAGTVAPPPPVPAAKP